MGGNQDSYRKMWHIMMTGRRSHVVKRVDRLSGLRVIRWWFGWLAWKMICWEAEWKKMFIFEKPLGSFKSKTQAMKEDQMHHLQWGKKITKLKVTRPQEWQNYLTCQETKTNNLSLSQIKGFSRSRSITTATVLVPYAIVGCCYETSTISILSPILELNFPIRTFFHSSDGVEAFHFFATNGWITKRRSGKDQNAQVGEDDWKHWEVDSLR